MPPPKSGNFSQDRPIDRGKGFFRAGLRQTVSRERRRGMVERGHLRLSISQQCHILGLARSTWYHRPKGESAMNLNLMRRIDEQFLETPFYGSRQMRLHLRHQGIVVGRGRVRRLMHRLELMAIYQKPKTSQPHPGHKIYPDLLRGVAIKRPDQVWCADITYVRMLRGFLYLVAVMDWHSRAVLSWRLSNTLDADFCVAALEESMNRYGVPEIFNTDHGRIPGWPLGLQGGMSTNRTIA